MAIKPILFNTKMVRANLDGRKACTRRLVNPRQFMGMLPDRCKNATPDEFLKNKRMMFKPYCDMTDAELIMTVYKEPYQPGDILYVRETWHKGLERYIYRADYSDTEKFYRDGKEIEMKWRPSIHMPKEAARIWLKVTDVRAERLQEMWASDVPKEGIYFTKPTTAGEMLMDFAKLWNSTIKKSDIDRYGWDANPWVWIIEFERCEKSECI